MGKCVYFQEGESIDYVNSGSAAINMGDVVVIGSHVGIAGDDIAVGDAGVLHVTGVFVMPKASSGAITLGADIKWDSSASVAAAASTGDTVIGYAVADAAADDTGVLVKLNG